MSASFERLHTKQVYLLIIVLLSALLCFWQLDEHSLEEWDEARYGVNAIEMIERNDFVNYYYENQPDQWNAKPPLSIWLIVLSYKVFGFNEFALRFPSAIAGVLIFALLFLIINYYRSLRFAFITCLILISTTSIIGGHVTRNGDMDALFILFNLGFIYYFIRYLHEKGNFIFPAMISLGLSFYTKGPAFLLLIPGCVLFLLIKGQILHLLKQRKVWLSVVLFLLIVGSWFVIQNIFGNTYDSPQFIGNNSWQTMWLYDVFGRFFNHEFNEEKMPGQYNFIISNLDVKFNLWNYLFYLSVILLFFKYRKNIKALKNNELLLLSLCLVITISVLLTFSQNKRAWYIAPIIPFVAIITVEGFRIIQNYKAAKISLLLLLVFTLSRQFYKVNTINDDRGKFMRDHKNNLSACKALFIAPDLTQDIKLYVYWYNKNVKLLQNNSIKTDNKSCYLLSKKINIEGHGKECRENICLYFP